MWAGPVLSVVTFAAVAAGTVLLNSLRQTLILSHIHYRHVLAATLLFIAATYAALTVGYSLSTGADSAVQANRATIMPAFLSVETDTKILVLREVGSATDRKFSITFLEGGMFRWVNLM